MITPDSLNTFAAQIIISKDVTETCIQRAISALYYGLFHTLASAGARVHAAGGQALQTQVARAYTHTTMAKVCRRYVSSPTQPFPSSVGLAVAPPDPRLITVADAFVKLQEARHVSDYDITAHIAQKDARDLLGLAAKATHAFADIEHLPETAVFLAALLLDDRWSRRA